MSLAARPLQAESELMEQPLTLSHTEGDSVILLEMLRQQQTIPKVLVISQFSGGTAYVVP